MKTWALGAMGTAVIATLVLVACGGSNGGGTTTTGTGAHTSTVSASHASSTGAGTGGSAATTTGAGGGDPCADMSDCSQCTTEATCNMCYSAVHQAGVNDYNNFISCLICDACYTVCMGSAESFCTGAPATKDACDIGTTTAQCQTCVMCAEGATCKTEAATCMANTDCKALLSVMCPTM